jgi:hypothetical protein
VSPEVRRLIRDMSLANPLWGAPRIHAEGIAAMDLFVYRRFRSGFCMAC